MVFPGNKSTSLSADDPPAYESPYDSYINYMNVLDNLRSRLGSAQSDPGEAVSAHNLR